MASPGQKLGGCGHLMEGFDTHSFCAFCRNKGKGPGLCISEKDLIPLIFLQLTNAYCCPLPSIRLKRKNGNPRKLVTLQQK